jgi:hypothetical protein
MLTFHIRINTRLRGRQMISPRVRDSLLSLTLSSGGTVYDGSSSKDSVDSAAGAEPRFNLAHNWYGQMAFQSAEFYR